MIKKIMRNIMPALYLRMFGIRFDMSWNIYGIPQIKKSNGASISIGKRFCAVSKSRFNSIGVSQPVMLFAVGKGSCIEIGCDVGISGSTVSAMNSITIEDNVLIGSGVIIIDNDAHPIGSTGKRYEKGDIKCKPVVIGKDVFIGARAIVLKGVHIGEGSTVGAGSVVSHSIPARVIAAGNPARVIRSI